MMPEDEDLTQALQSQVQAYEQLLQLHESWLTEVDVNEKDAQNMAQHKHLARQRLLHGWRQQTFKSMQQEVLLRYRLESLTKELVQVEQSLKEQQAATRAAIQTGQARLAVVERAHKVTVAQQELSLEVSRQKIRSDLEQQKNESDAVARHVLEKGVLKIFAKLNTFHDTASQKIQNLEQNLHYLEQETFTYVKQREKQDWRAKYESLLAERSITQSLESQKDLVKAPTDTTNEIIPIILSPEQARIRELQQMTKALLRGDV